jgi:hypothetical protein
MAVNRQLGELIDETFEHLYMTRERPTPVVAGTTLAATTQATEFELTAGADKVSITDAIEFGDELLLVTKATDDPQPRFTAIRGYANTKPRAIAAGDIGLLNPYWTRSQVGRLVQRFFTGVAQTWLPLVEGEIMITSDLDGVAMQFLPVPDYMLKVRDVRFMSPMTGRIINVPGWRFEENLPPEVSTSTKAIRVPSLVTPADDLLITFDRKYQWAGVGEDAFINMPDGADDIPSLWVAAVLTTGREVSRLELDKLTEQATEAASRQGSNVNIIKLTWQNVYRRIDEARRINPVPRNLVYRRAQKV